MSIKDNGNEFDVDAQGVPSASVQPVAASKHGTLHFKNAPKRKVQGDVLKDVTGDVGTRDAVEFAGQAADLLPEKLVPGGGAVKKSVGIAAKLFEANEEGEDGKAALEDISERYGIPLDTLLANSAKLRLLAGNDQNSVYDQIGDMAPELVGETIGGGAGLLVPIPGLNFVASYIGSTVGGAAGSAIGGEVQNSFDPKKPAKGVDIRTIFFKAEDKQMKAAAWLQDERNVGQDLPSELRVSKLEAALLAMDEREIQEVSRKAKKQIAKNEDPAIAQSKLKGIVYSSSATLNLKVSELESMGLVQVEPGERPETTIARAMNTFNPKTGEMVLHPLALIMDDPSQLAGMQQDQVMVASAEPAIRYDQSAQSDNITVPSTLNTKKPAGRNNTPVLNA